MLTEAVRACPDQAVVRLALQDYYRTRPDSDVSETVRQLLGTQGLEFSLPIIARSVQDLQTSREQLSLFEEPLRHWLEKHPDDANGLRLAARLWLRLERPEEARRALRHLLSVQPSPQVRHYCILLDVMLERWADALELMKPQLEVDDSARLRLQMARALSEIGQYEAMMEVVTPLLSEPGFSWELEFLIPAGWALWDNNKKTEAENLFRTLGRLQPNNIQIQTIVLHLFADDKERAEMRAAVEQQWALEEDPIQLINEGANRLAAGEDATAYELLERATAMLPGSEVGWLNLGIAAKHLERWEKAEHSFTRALDISPDLATALYLRGQVRIEREDHDGAVTDLERALLLEPGKKDIYYFLYLCHETLGNTEKAAEAQRQYREQG